MTDSIPLSDLDLDSDPGTDWHPREKPGARDVAGNLADLDDIDVEDHRTKPEVVHQPDAEEPLAAEDSALSPDGVV